MTSWDEVAHLGQGDLTQVPYPVLLASLGRARRSVVVELTRKPVTKRVFLENGAPVDCRSNLAHETFGRFLVGAGKLSEEEFPVLLAESLRREVPLGEVLLERGKVDAVELYRLLQQSVARRLLDPFTWREGSFRLVPLGESPDTSLKVKMPQLILTGVSKLTPMAQVNAAIQPLLAAPLGYDPQAPVDQDELVLKGAPAAVAEALRKRPLRVDELARETGAGGDELGRAIYALALLGLVVPASRIATAGAARELGDRAFKTRAVPIPGAAGAPAIDLEALRGRILGASLVFRRRDAFDLLEIPEEADRAAVEEACLRFAEAYAPWVPAALGLDDLADKARALFLAGAQAYAELADNERRGTVVHRRKLAREERERKEASEPKIETDLLDPAVQFRRGQQLLEGGDRKRALEYLQYAADLDAQNALYRAEAAWCRYEISPGSSRKSVLEELTDAVRVDPRCGVAWYYLGRVEADTGLDAAAEEHLRRALKLMSPDRRPIEALKELTGKKKG